MYFMVSVLKLYLNSFDWKLNYSKLNSKKNNMKTHLFKLSCFLLFTSSILLNGCKSDLFEPSIEGTWIEIDSTTTKNPTGCKLVIDKENGEVTLCGFMFVHPHNVVTLTTKKKAKLIIRDGQMHYRQKKSDFLWIAPIAREDHYFIDYDIDGEFLWIVGDNSQSKTSAIGVGKVFIKQ